MYGTIFWGKFEIYKYAFLDFCKVPEPLTYTKKICV